MEITHIRNHKDQWIFEYGTALETKEVKRLVLRLQEDFHATVKEVSDGFAVISPTAE
jgi:hypothetical protein